MPFYVYLKWSSPTNIHRADYESRYAADEFFRALQELDDRHGKPRFTLLKRSSAQFWCYDTAEGDPWWLIVRILRDNAIPEANFKIMSTILQDAAGDGRPWHFIKPVDGPDWTNGSTFFIRNKRQPNLYWSVSEVTPDATIVISDTQNSKFRISGVDRDPKDREKVLIRGDRVTISPASSETGPKALFIGPSKCETDIVVVGNVSAEPLTCNKVDGDEWELC
ncbi:hypothetical protein SISNIDRAFT_479574 [Sistotremastrum niveocremeum HHB9708]|uniref:Uncharacterized protein n=1 Tax=Sistotremastrum niveocremeum HHB9708 TaxID=1314777 RepID=A0A164R261_9AGAM|nr:hypothetical protein SISNIDRAFT_479574 [Sistotremastrum niveocremeum HHB9708]